MSGLRSLSEVSEATGDLNLLAALHAVEEHLSTRDFLVGKRLTEAICARSRR